MLLNGGLQLYADAQNVQVVQFWVGHWLNQAVPGSARQKNINQTFTFCGAALPLQKYENIRLPNFKAQTLLRVDLKHSLISIQTLCDLDENIYRLK